MAADPEDQAALSYRLVIFDFDGTLADSLPWFRGVFNEVAIRHGFRTLQPAEFEALRGLPSREVMRRIGVPVWKLPIIANDMKSLMARDIASIKLFDGVPEMLRGLKSAGVRLAVVSSNSEGNVRRVLGPDNAFRIDHFGCGVAIFGKAARFKAILRHAQVEPALALCVGDEIRDAEASKASGIPFAAVAWGYATPESLKDHASVALFERVSDIVPTVLGVEAV
ncbi:HAD hydrolase-like protein [Skermanella stibiiresistens]|uniref:HAD hydrolase-like protein n=1 Tax=Skermanella stibiiresistens TaxID=913326 RepID=UPI0004B72821|nr:HAD hydrolase-like protein [Skermanella stibiiresistens]